jgi:exosortase/archaeosortase family protein
MTDKAATEPPARDPVDKTRSRRRPIVRFLVLFASSFGVFYVLLSTTYARETLRPILFDLNARIAAGVLRLLGEPATATQNQIDGASADLGIGPGCDATEAWGLFACGILAFRAPVKSKLAGLVFGSIAIGALNVVRLLSLYAVQARWPQAFDVMHVDVWQTAFPLLVLGLWVAWALLATRRAPGTAAPSRPIPAP